MLEPHATFVSTVSDTLAAATRNGKKAYWLLDPTALPSPAWLDQCLMSMPAIDLLQGHPQPRSDGVSPLLVSAGSVQKAEQLANELHRVARYANAVSLLVSHKILQELQRDLAARLRVKLPHGLHAMLRAFDTRTLAGLPGILNDSQWAAMTEGIDSWIFLDRRGWVRHLPKATGESADPLPIVLSQAQEQALVDDGLADAVIDLLITHAHPALQGKTPPQQFELVEPLVATGVRYGLAEPPSAYAFAHMAFEQREGFHEHEPWASVLADIAAGRRRWDEVLT